MVSHKNYHLDTNKGFLIPLASNFYIFCIFLTIPLWEHVCVCVCNFICSRAKMIH